MHFNTLQLIIINQETEFKIQTKICKFYIWIVADILVLVVKVIFFKNNFEISAAFRFKIWTPNGFNKLYQIKILKN